MQEKSIQRISKRKKRDEAATIVAGIYGVTPRYVRMVIEDQHDREDILTTYIEYQQFKSQFIEKAKALVPFN